MAGYLGNIPSAAPLTSADIADGIITSAKIVDGTIVNADINASSAIALSKLSATGTSLQVLRMNSGATALEFGTVSSEVKSWVNFDGTGTISIRASFNVSSLTDDGTGSYSVNFTTAMTDVNYSAVANCSRDASVEQTGIYITHSQNTVSKVQVQSLSNTLTPIFYDVNTVLVAVFR